MKIKIDIQPRDHILISNDPNGSDELRIYVTNDTDREIRPKIRVEFPEDVVFMFSGETMDNHVFTDEDYLRKYGKEFIVRPKSKRKIVLVPVYLGGKSRRDITKIVVNVEGISLSRRLKTRILGGE